MAGKARTETADDQTTDEAWIRAAGGETAIRVRSLTRYLEKGGQVLSVRLTEDLEGLYSIWVRLADRPGEFRLNQFHADVPKTFKDVGAAIDSIRDDLSYFGDIAVATDRRPAT